MKIVHVNLVMMILFSATLVSSGYAGAICCDPGAGCCGTPNISADQQRLHAPFAGSDPNKPGTVKKPTAQLNRMPWSATVNQIGAVRLAPSVSPGCCPGTNITGGCCDRDPKSTLPPRPGTSMVDEVLAFNPFLGTLW
jgi:hypothetical protein